MTIVYKTTDLEIAIGYMRMNLRDGYFVSAYRKHHDTFKDEYQVTISGLEEYKCEADTPQTERDAYWKELFEAVVKGEMSDASANQAWYEYINKQDTPQTDCEITECDYHKYCKERGQTDCGWK